jgi:hypothetical protein
LTSVTAAGAGTPKALPKPSAFAAEQMARLNLPATINLSNGKVVLKLDSQKFWNINRIDVIANGKKRNFGMESPGSHYGMVYRELNTPFFIGSGHCESGKCEQVTSLRIFADGKEVKPGKETIRGKKIRMEKVSGIGPLTVQYSFEINENRLDEECTVTSQEAVKCHCMYFFMHPWSTRFKEMHTLRPDGTKTSQQFKSDNGHPSGVVSFYPIFTLYDPDSGDALLTKVELVEGASAAPKRYMWDRRVYRKDYTVDYVKKVFPAGHKAVYRSSTVFFPNNGKPVIPQIEK